MPDEKEKEGRPKMEFEIPENPVVIPPSPSTDIPVVSQGGMHGRAGSRIDRATEKSQQSMLERAEKCKRQIAAITNMKQCTEYEEFLRERGYYVHWTDDGYVWRGGKAPIDIRKEATDLYDLIVHGEKRGEDK